MRSDQPEGPIPSPAAAVRLDYLRVVRKAVVLQGNASLPAGGRARESESRFEVGIGPLRFAASRMERSDLDARRVGFQSFVPVADWPVGECRPRLHVWGQGEAGEPMVASPAFYRTWRAAEAAELGFGFALNAGNEVVIKRRSAPRGRRRALASELVAALGRTVLSPRSPAGWVLLSKLFELVGLHDVWLLADTSDELQDGGSRLAEYLAGSPVAGVRPVLVVGPGSRARRPGLGPVVTRGSISHRVALARAGALVGAESSLFPPTWDRERRLSGFLARVDVRRVLLWDGPVPTGDDTRRLHRLDAGYDLVVVPGEPERNFFSAELGYGASVAVAAGSNGQTVEAIRRLWARPH